MNNIWKAVLVACAVAVVLPAAAEDPVLGAGGVRLSGKVNAYGQYSIRARVRQGGAGLFTILAVKVYAEPSHTFLCAVVDDSAPVALLESISSERPRGLSATAIGTDDMTFGMEAPPQEDSRIRVVYVVRQGQDQAERLMADASVQSTTNFEFSVEPQIGGNIKRCGWCPPDFCGCIYCSGPQFTLCCPGCSMECALILCP